MLVKYLYQSASSKEYNICFKTGNKKEFDDGR